MGKNKKNRNKKHKQPQQHSQPAEALHEAPQTNKAGAEQTVSPEKLVANRQNAQRSTGPQTEEGKQTSAMNAAKHYLTSKKVIAPGENEDEFYDLQVAILNELSPVGFLEYMAAKRYAAYVWRLNRVFRQEQKVQAIHDLDEKMKQLERLARYERQIRREMERDLAEFRHLVRNATFDAIEQERRRREEAAKESGEAVETTDLAGAAFRVTRHTLPIKQLLAFMTTPARGDLFGFVWQGVPPLPRDQAA